MSASGGPASLAGQRADDPRYVPGPRPQPEQRADEPRQVQGPAAVQPPQDVQDAVTTTRQFVGSLTPMPLESDEPIELPMRGMVFTGVSGAGRPARARPLLRRVLLALGIALVAVLVAVVWFLRRPRPAPAPAAPIPTTLVSTEGGGEVPLPAAVPTAPAPTLEPGETAAPTTETSGAAPPAKGSAASLSRPGPVPSAKASGDELANPYR